MIPFYRPPKPKFDELIVDLAQIMDSGTLTNGEYCRQLEEEVKKLHRVDHVITCASATAGMKLLLTVLSPLFIALPIFTWKSNDILTHNTARLWMDIDRETWLPIPPEGAATAYYTLDTFIFQHTFGNLFNPHAVGWDKFEAKHRSAQWIHDAAYSLGLEFPVNDGAVISMSPTKTVTACEGGLILVNEQNKAEALMKLRDVCSRMSEMHAAVALHYLGMLPKILARKKQVFDYYNRNLGFPHQRIPEASTYGYYGMLVENRDSLQDPENPEIYHIGEVECRVRYSTLYRGDCTPNSDYVSKHIICLPYYPSVDEKAVVEEVLKVLEK